MITGKTPTNPLTVTYLPVGELVPDPRNARTHSKRHIIAGHGRLLAAKDMGMAEVPVIALADLSEVQKRALRLPGDIWILGDHRVGCRDGRNPDLLRKVVGADTKVDVAFFDPLQEISVLCEPVK